MREILVLQPPHGELKGVLRALRGAAGGAPVLAFESGAALLSRLEAGANDPLVVLDWFLGDGQRPGRELLTEIRRRRAQAPVLVVAAEGDVASAAAAVAAGATDFLVRGARLGQRVRTALSKVNALFALMEKNRVLREQNRLLRQESLGRYRIVGESPQLVALIEQIARVAAIPRPLLVLGERGTGKELVAWAVHEASGRKGPFVAVNCAAFTDTLLESELFGHERGAFTGAEAVTSGKFEQAAGGTLFLDEIGNMSLPFQQKVLRVVEYGVFTRVGGHQEFRTDARIVAATNADLEQRMAKGEFLRDLYDRLAFEVLEVPPLRARQGDVELLARHFLAEFMREVPLLAGKRFAPEALAELERYGFPGNVRELKHIVERAAYRDTTNEISGEDLGLGGRPGASRPAAPGDRGDFHARVAALQRQLVEEALEQAKGNGARAARALGLPYHQFRYHLAKARQTDER